MLRKGCTPQAKQISDLKTFPIPASTRWLRRTLPTSSPACSRRRRGGFVRSKLTAQHIRAQTCHACKSLQRPRGVKTGHRNIKGNCHNISCAQHNPHLAARALPPLAGSVDVPAPAHQHVCRQDEIAGEMDEQPLAARLHLLDGPPGHRALIVRAGQRRIICFEVRDLVTSQSMVQSTSRAEDGVAFRHWERRLPAMHDDS